MKNRNGTLIFGLLIALALLALFKGSVTASTPNSDSPLGANLHIFDSWSSEYTTVDIFKQSSVWRAPVNGAWKKLTPAEIDVDENGWVRSLTNPQTGGTYEWIGTLMFEGLDGHYPEGEYTVVYEGEGSISYAQNAVSVQHVAPNKDIVTVDPNHSLTGFLLKITETDPHNTGNYIRNIRVYMPGYDETTTQTFHPTFLKNTERYKVLRFMDWMRTNWRNGVPMRESTSDAVWTHPLHDATQSPYFVYVDPARAMQDEWLEWADRPKMSDARYSTTDGVPLEMMIALSNQINADPWFNMPHHASDEYMLQFALMVRNRLEANRYVYVELSNEVWNGSFYQKQWFEQKGQAEWPESDKPIHEKGWNYFGKRSAEMCDMWELAFGAQADRVICVIATQATNPWLGERMLTCPLWDQGPCHAHHVDAVAIAPYFGQHIGKEVYRDLIKTEWLTPTSDGLTELFQELTDGSLLPEEQYVTRVSLPIAKQFITEYATLADSFNLDLVAYEGGQHLVGVEGTVVEDATMTELFINANRDPRMAPLYAEYYAHWRAAGGKMFMHYATLGTYSKHGNWGAQEYADSVGMPKIAANYDFIDTHSCDWSTCETPGSYTPTAVTMNGAEAATVSLQLLIPMMLLLLFGTTAWLKRS